MQKNAKTGLLESHDARYKIPVVHQRGVGQIRFDGQPRAIHKVPYRPGRTLDFYSRLLRSDEIVVAFHGKTDLEKGGYPAFAHLANLSGKTSAMMSFADPAAATGPDGASVLPWYLGGPGWDPLLAILQVVRKAQGRTGARHIAFVGGSGGGFAALRASAMVRGSMAFVHDPQTSVAAYGARAAIPYFESTWPGWKRDELIEAFPDRFDMAQHYRNANPENFVYYAQNASDFSHVRKHLGPFRVANGIPSGPRVHRGTRRIVDIYDGEVEGHGQITTDEFNKFFGDAVESWRSYRENLN